MTMIHDATVHKLPTSNRKVRTRGQHRAVRVARRQLVAGAMVATVGVVLTALSLTHLARGLEIVTHVPTWEAWATSIGIDLAFVAMEYATVAAGELARKAAHRFTRWMIPGTMIGSAILNAFAFGADADGWMLYPAVAIGAAVPGMIYGLFRIATAMWLKK